MELARKYLQTEKEKQAEQEKANMSLEQKQQQSIEQPELEAFYYVDKTWTRLFEIGNNQSLSNTDKDKKLKPIFTEFLNYAKKLKNTDPTTYEKISKDCQFELIEIIEKNLEIIRENERNLNIER